MSETVERKWRKRQPFLPIYRIRHTMSSPMLRMAMTGFDEDAYHRNHTILLPSAAHDNESQVTKSHSQLAEQESYPWSCNRLKSDV